MAKSSKKIIVLRKYSSVPTYLFSVDGNNVYKKGKGMTLNRVGKNDKILSTIDLSKVDVIVIGGK